MKDALRKIVTSRFFTPFWLPLTKGRICIFTLHRFAVPDLGVEGHDSSHLRRTLARLRQDRYALVALDQVVDELQNGSRLDGRTVAFTVDDGYLDFALVGAQVFSEFDCPVTVFLTTGFVDGDRWQWWDQIEYVVMKAEGRAVRASVSELSISIDLGSRPQRLQQVHHLWALCKQIPDSEKWTVIQQLAADAGVEIPATAPSQYAPMSWDRVRTLEQRGVTFGPHTVSHPILTRTTDQACDFEIRRSWERVHAELESPVPILAYPNGWADEREFRIARDVGLSACLTTEPNYVTRTTLTASPMGRYRIPRFGYPEEPDRVQVVSSGLHRISKLIRQRTLGLRVPA